MDCIKNHRPLDSLENEALEFPGIPGDSRGFPGIPGKPLVACQVTLQKHVKHACLIPGDSRGFPAIPKNSRLDAPRRFWSSPNGFGRIWVPSKQNLPFSSQLCDLLVFGVAAPELDPNSKQNTIGHEIANFFLQLCVASKSRQGLTQQPFGAQPNIDTTPLSKQRCLG